VEDQFLQEHFSHILAKSVKERRNLSEAEQEILGYTHTEIGMAIIENWDFPQELVLSIGYHHAPEKVFSPFGKLVSTLYVADYFCQESCIGYGDIPFRDGIYFEKCLNELEIKPHALDLIMKGVKQDLARMEDQGLL